MNSRKHENVSEIVSEMREFADTDSQTIGRDVLRRRIQHFARRFEAAAKREREAGAEAAQICGEIGELIGREAACKEKVTDCNHLGNAAAMREALSDACYAMFNFLKTQNGGYEEMAKALDKAKAALADPPRNCDVGTADEQHARFYSFCDKFEECKECPLWRGGGLTSKCCAHWGQMPYEEGGAE